MPLCDLSLGPGLPLRGRRDELERSLEWEDLEEREDLEDLEDADLTEDEVDLDDWRVGALAWGVGVALLGGGIATAAAEAAVASLIMEAMEERKDISMRDILRLNWSSRAVWIDAREVSENRDWSGSSAGTAGTSAGVSALGTSLDFLTEALVPTGSTGAAEYFAGLRLLADFFLPAILDNKTDGIQREQNLVSYPGDDRGWMSSGSGWGWRHTQMTSRNRARPLVGKLIIPVREQAWWYSSDNYIDSSSDNY